LIILQAHFNYRSMDRNYRGNENRGKGKSGKNPKEESLPRKDTDSTRLNKFIANSGLCSRREADIMISDGLIKVNGKVVTEMGTKVGPEDEVYYGNKKLSGESKVYILLNKPKGYITSVKDEQDRDTVMELIKNACKERVYPVGRLDRNSTGLLLITNDGDLSKKLTHPKHEKKKIYLVGLDKNLSTEHLEAIANGIELEDGFIRPDAISYAQNGQKNEVGIEIHSGRNRIVRRIFEHFEYKVLKLDRVYFAGLTKKSLPRGKWRFLSDKEVSMLKMNAFD
jgi:23S rRNA pseudouridine2605 synthase